MFTLGSIVLLCDDRLEARVARVERVLAEIIGQDFRHNWTAKHYDWALRWLATHEEFERFQATATYESEQPKPDDEDRADV